MSNVINRDTDGAIIGYSKDIQEELKQGLRNFANDNEWEEVKELADLLLDLNGWQDSPNLLVLSDNNGMGYTIREYKGE
jgi:hypothetical protein